MEYHRKHATTTAKVGYCVDVAHGYANRTQQIIHDHVALLDASVPYLYELHLKNTDALYNSTFGFSESERKRGIIDVAPLLRRLQTQAARLPVKVIGAYLEIGGPKTGRDYSDCHLEKALLDSLQFLKPIIEEVNRGGKPSSTASDSITPTNAPVASNATIKLATDKVQVAPSMMCADALNLQLAAEQMEQIGVSAFHIDIMDGHFAPNLSMALPQVEQLATRSKVPLDVHLMVENNDLFVELLGRMRIWQITVHAESSLHLDRTLAQIRKLGIRAGVALNPHTSVETLRYILPRVDTVLVMTVNPGFAGQQLVPSAIEKIRDVKRFLIARDSSASVAVDGNVSFENIPAMVAAGADYLVGGTSSLFAKQGQLADLVHRVNQTVAEGLQRRSQSA